MPVIAAVAACLAAVVRNLVSFGARSHDGALFAPGALRVEIAREPI